MNKMTFFLGKNLDYTFDATLIPTLTTSMWLRSNVAYAALSLAKREQQRKQHVARLMARHRAAVTLQVWWRYCLWRNRLRLRQQQEAQAAAEAAAEAAEAKARAAAHALARPRPSATTQSIASAAPAPVSPRAVRPDLQPGTPTSLAATSAGGRTLVERLAQASPAAQRQRKNALSPFRVLAGSSKWRSASAALPSEPLPEGMPLEALQPSMDGPPPAAAPDSLEAKRALLLKIRSQRKRLETQLLTQSGSNAFSSAMAAVDRRDPGFGAGHQDDGSQATSLASAGGFARLAARRNSNSGVRGGGEETVQEREQTRITRFNTLHNSHSITNFDLPAPEDFDAQQRFLEMVCFFFAFLPLPLACLDR